MEKMLLAFTVVALTALGCSGRDFQLTGSALTKTACKTSADCLAGFECEIEASGAFCAPHQRGGSGSAGNDNRGPSGADGHGGAAGHDADDHIGDAGHGADDGKGGDAGHGADDGKGGHDGIDASGGAAGSTPGCACSDNGGDCSNEGPGSGCGSDNSGKGNGDDGAAGSSGLTCQSDADCAGGEECQSEGNQHSCRRKD